MDHASSRERCHRGIHIVVVVRPVPSGSGVPRRVRNCGEDRQLRDAPGASRFLLYLVLYLTAPRVARRRACRAQPAIPAVSSGDVGVRGWPDGFIVRFLTVRRDPRRALSRLKPGDKDVEIAVLRHQLAVLKRQVPRSRYSNADRCLLSMLARLLIRERWGVFLVTPATLLHWELVRRHWTQPHGRPRRGRCDETVELVLRLARENYRWGYAHPAPGGGRAGPPPGRPRRRR
jgi:hypothetical protein